MIGNAERLAVPVFDDAVEQVQVFRRVDDAGRITGTEAHRDV